MGLNSIFHVIKKTAVKVLHPGKPENGEERNVNQGLSRKAGEGLWAFRYPLTAVIVLAMAAAVLYLGQDFESRRVAGLSSEKVHAGMIRLSWEPVSGCDGYLISRYSRGREKWETIARIRSPKVCRYEDDVNANRVREYSVKAYKEKGKGKEICTQGTVVKGGGLSGYETIGHRGAMDMAPDDTIASFERAKKSGYTTFECDIWYTQNRDLFIFHDFTLDDLTGKGGRSTILSEDNYLMYPITKGKNSDKYSVQYPSDLDEVLKWGKDHDMDMIIHIKVNDVWYDDLFFKKALASLKKYHMEDRVLFFSSSFRVCRLMSRFPVRKGFLTGNQTELMRRYAIDFAKENHCEMIIIKYTDYWPLSPDTNRYAHENGIKTCVYNIKRKDQIRNLINSRTDYWIVNRLLVRPKRK